MVDMHGSQFCLRASQHTGCCMIAPHSIAWLSTIRYKAYQSRLSVVHFHSFLNVFSLDRLHTCLAGLPRSSLQSLRCFNCCESRSIGRLTRQQIRRLADSRATSLHNIFNAGLHWTTTTVPRRFIGSSDDFIPPCLFSSTVLDST